MSSTSTNALPGGLVAVTVHPEVNEAIVTAHYIERGKRKGTADFVVDADKFLEFLSECGIGRRVFASAFGRDPSVQKAHLVFTERFGHGRGSFPRRETYSRYVSNARHAQLIRLRNGINDLRIKNIEGPF